MNDRPRGLGRGLSALLGEPMSTSFGQPKEQRPPAPAAAPPSQPAPANPYAAGAAFTPVSTSSFAAAAPSPSVYAPAPVAAPASVNHDVAAAPDTVVTPFPTPPAVAPPPAAAPVVAAETSALPPSVVARMIPIDLIQRNPNQPRKRFDESDLSELADSIRARGVLQPILVRPAPGAPDRIEIVAGEPRWRASQREGLHQIPAVVQDFDEVEVLEIGIIENVQRADLNPLEEAQGYQALIERFGRTQQEIAEVVGKSRPHIANMLRLLGLPNEIQDMVRDGRLTAGHARAILAAPNPVELARMAIAQALNVREVERLASQAKEDKHGPRVRTGGAEKDADTRALEAQIGAALGLTVTITHKGEAGGKLEIGYRTLEQLDDLCRKLSGG
ncbi:MAG: ParB/RepB/Spo0J family partition protein [Hyphomonadaceae bacterium]|nr:ParB/RepB/Spo0J family partition protein [Hyphomonadaceae bacterium]